MQPQLIQVPRPALEKAALIAELLRERYGADAVHVAELQACEADGDNGVTWRAIVRLLSL